MAGFAVEPLTSVADTSRAADSSTTVSAFSRRGVIHEKCLAATNDLIPLALAVAPIAVIMHCMHIAPEG